MERLRSLFRLVGELCWRVYEWRPTPKPKPGQIDWEVVRRGLINDYVFRGFDVRQSFILAELDIERMRNANRDT